MPMFRENVYYFLCDSEGCEKEIVVKKKLYSYTAADEARLAGWRVTEVWIKDRYSWKVTCPACRKKGAK